MGLVDKVAEPVLQLISRTKDSLSLYSASWNFCWGYMAQYYSSARMGRSLFCMGISASNSMTVHSPRIDTLYISVVQFKLTCSTFA